MTQHDLMIRPDASSTDAEGEADEPTRLGRKRDHSRDQQILDAAIEVLAEEGYEGMTVDMVAARAKAGKATVYRRWPSKSELVIDAVACMKRSEFDPDDLPDTGSLRGDLMQLIRPHSVEESAQKLQVVGGLVSMLSRDPHLAEAVNQAITAPRAALNRRLMQRAIDRGEISADADIETVSQIGPAMVAYRVLMLRKPADREFLITMTDTVILPALGLPARP